MNQPARQPQPLGLLAYTPPAATSLTPAQRAQLVSALCERARKRQEANVKSNKAANARWTMEMAQIKQRQQSHPPAVSRPLPVTLSMPMGPAPSAVFATPFVEPPASSAKPKYIVVQEVEDKVPETTTPEPESPTDVVDVTKASAAVLNDKPVAVAAPTMKETEVPASEVVRPSIVDAIRSSLDKMKSDNGATVAQRGEEEKEELEEEDVLEEEQGQIEGQERASFKAVVQAPDTSMGIAPVAASETGVVRPSVFDAVEPAVAKLEAHKNSRNDNDISGDDEAAASLRTATATAVSLPGAEHGVIRPCLTDAIGSFFSNMHVFNGFERRMKTDSKRLKEMTAAATATGALMAFFSLKK